MGAIAYITDSKLLELHRLNAHRTMNFWRLSAKTGFTDFQKGDLVFFLSKDKAHMRKKEKGIVGVHLFTAGEGILPKFYEDFRFSKENRVILMGREL